MRPLANKTNVTPPGGDYPYGRIKDNTGGNNGTPVNEAVYGDIHQFFERLMAQAGLSGNNLPDNNANGFQLFTALETYLKRIAPQTIAQDVTAVGNIGTGEDLLHSLVIPANTLKRSGDLVRITSLGFFSQGGGGNKSLNSKINGNYILFMTPKTFATSVVYKYVLEIARGVSNTAFLSSSWLEISDSTSTLHEERASVGTNTSSFNFDNTLTYELFGQSALGETNLINVIYSKILYEPAA